MAPKSPPPPVLPQRLSLVAQTVRSLHESIRAGHWRGHLPGERELSRHLQVSRGTLRAALQELQRKGWLVVAQRQRRRIPKQRPAPAGAASATVIGFLSPVPLQAFTLFQIFLLDELRAKLARAGYRLELHTNRECFAARPARVLENLVLRAPAAAWLIMTSTDPVPRWFVRRRLPCLVLGSCAPDIALPSFDLDFRAACRHAGGLLLRKGHRCLALVLPSDGGGASVATEQGLREALAGAPAAQLRVLRHDSTAVGIRIQLDAALCSALPPTAMLVARAGPMLTVVTHLIRCGRRIPQDVAVISRDDESFLHFVAPTIARYAINRADFARRILSAVRQLVETGTLPARAIRLMPKFIAGETV